jgi:hypothetical protein
MQERRQRLGRPGAALLALGLALALLPCRALPDTPARVQASGETSRQKANTMQIRLTINDKTLTASLDDNPTSRDFAALLPMTLRLEDYAATEKISTLPRKLSTAGAPAGTTPAIGDIAYYAPWGNLAIFHKDFAYSKGLIKLGRIDAGIERLSAPGPVTVTVERSEP